MTDLSIFCYRQGNSILHKIPSWIKILFIPLFNIAIFLLNWKIAAIFILIFTVTFLLLRFSLIDIFTDLKPVLYYGIFLYFMNIFIQLNSLWGNGNLKEILILSFFNSIKDKDTGFFCLRFCVCVQSCALMFKTTSSIQIRSGIETIEIFIRKFLPVKKEPVFAFAISMLLIFIPTVFKLWNQLKRAWIARGGKNSFKMILVLIPQLFSLGLKHSLDTTKSVLNRNA